MLVKAEALKYIFTSVKVKKVETLKCTRNKKS